MDINTLAVFWVIEVLKVFILIEIFFLIKYFKTYLKIMSSNIIQNNFTKN
jgi:hypothetical protein